MNAWRRWVGLLVLLGGTVAWAESPRYISIELKLSSYTPNFIDSGLPSQPYASTFGSAGLSMLRFDGDFEKFVYQGWGSALVGIGAGYAEKFTHAHTLSSATSLEATGIKFIPLRVVAEYRFDYAALHLNIPLIPYVKAGLTAIPWQSVVGSNTETLPGGQVGAGIRYGYLLSAGIALQLDFLDQSAIRDVDTDIGINHFYFFAEYDYEEVNSFGAQGLNLTSRRWGFGLALDY